MNVDYVLHTRRDFVFHLQHFGLLYYVRVPSSDKEGGACINSPTHIRKRGHVVQSHMQSVQIGPPPELSCLLIDIEVGQ